MEHLREYILNKLTDLHVSINYGTKYENNERGASEKLRDIHRYEGLKEIIRDNNCFDDKEMGQEVSKRIQERLGF